MADQLLIRAFDVEVGDCFYVRIPDARVSPETGERDDFHMLVDCGTKGKGELVERAVENLRELLPESGSGDGKRLDLLVVTHEHQDHIKGFDPLAFEGIEVRRVWLSAAMDPDHPDAETTRGLHAFAARSMRAAAASGRSFSPALHELMDLYRIDNEGAMEALRSGLTEPEKVVYVDVETPAEDLALPLDGAEFHVLGPEHEIDHFYLGEEDERRFRAVSGQATERPAGEPDVEDVLPANVSASDFHRLRSRMMSNAFAFAELESKVKNNASLVLLLSWQGRRLLFVGDAEWEDEFETGRHNGGWNVMWNERRGLLDGPVDFLKIGHHGSTNSTPWAEARLSPESEPARILDAILPLPDDGEEATARALVSTRRKNYKSIPRSELLAEIGRRVGNTRVYRDELEAAGVDPRSLRHYDELEKPWLGKPQPPRTDLERLLTGVDWVDVELEPGRA